MTPGERLLRWFAEHARDLPWRGEPRDPYRVLVSEVMLQQTQVERVRPRFEAFVARFPTLEALAAAPEEAVLERWSGLGYYRRASRLHRLAREVVAGGGELPADACGLGRLPGVGPYTAAAVASLAFGLPEPVLDGNVMRVGARVLALEADPRGAAGRRALAGWARSLMDGSSPGPVNEALMELGATVCLPATPRCDACPLAEGCAARVSGSPEAFPPPRRRRAAEDHRWVAACCVDRAGRWLLRRVSEGPILRGLWLPPFAPLTDAVEPVQHAQTLIPVPAVGTPEELPPVRHSITHRRITVVPVRVNPEAADPPDGWRWVDPDDPGVPTSSLLRKLVVSAIREVANRS